jgi:hypothetical protein
LPATPRHYQSATLKSPRQEGRNHVLDLSADVRDDPDAGRRQNYFLGMRQHSTYQHIRPEMTKKPGPIKGIAGLQVQLLTVFFPAALNVEQKYASRNIKDRRNPALPVRNRNLHVLLKEHTACHPAGKRA